MVENATSTTKTTQLRRYVIAEGYFDSYVEWWVSQILPLRRAAGFSVVSAYADRAHRQIVWALATEGGQDEFGRLESIYFESEARRIAFDGVPEWVESSKVSFVEDVASNTAGL